VAERRGGISNPTRFDNFFDKIATNLSCLIALIGSLRTRLFVTNTRLFVTINGLFVIINGLFVIINDVL
jgi:hypothetical protein